MASFNQPMTVSFCPEQRWVVVVHLKEMGDLVF
jgi:hypothetical protein